VEGFVEGLEGGDGVDGWLSMRGRKGGDGCRILRRMRRMNGKEGGWTTYERLVENGHVPLDSSRKTPMPLPHINQDQLGRYDKKGTLRIDVPRPGNLGD
jgi:hypothetical protein